MSAPILVAVDFSRDAEAALEWALRAGVAFAAPILVVHVVHDPPDSPGTYAGEGNTLSEFEDVATKMLDDFLDGMGKKFQAGEQLPGLSSRVVVGLPVGRILEVADQEGAQMIVMGGRGRSGLADVLLGSKVERVARLSRVPVVIVRAPDVGPVADAGR